MEEVNAFEYLGTILCKHESMEGETRERTAKGRSMSMEVKRDLRNTAIVPTLTYASETWAWNESQR